MKSWREKGFHFSGPAGSAAGRLLPVYVIARIPVCSAVSGKSIPVMAVLPNRSEAFPGFDPDLL